MAISQRCLLLRKLSQLKSNIFKLTIIPGCNYRSVVCLHVTVFICALNTYRTVFSWTCASRQHPACENLAPAIYEKLSNSINKKLSYWYQVVLIIIYQSFCQTWHLECSSSHDGPSVKRRVLIITWQSFWSNTTVAVIAHVWRLTVVIDFVHYICCIFEMKRFIVTEMAFNGHSVSSAMSSFIRSLRFLSETGKSRLQLFLDKIAEMTLKSIKVVGDSHISLSVSGL